MADTLIAEPSGSAVSLTGWQRIISKLTKQSKGLAAVSFDDYADGATAPSVVAGGIYEINGSYYEVTSDTEITGMSVASTTYYVYSTSGTWSASTTAPVWSESKQGWYLSTDANARCLFRVTTRAGGEYDDRYKLSFGRQLFDDKIYVYGGIEGAGAILTTLNVSGTGKITGDATFSSDINLGGKINVTGVSKTTATTQNGVYDALDSYIPLLSQENLVSGGVDSVPVSYAKRTGLSEITLYMADGSTIVCTNGNATSIGTNVSLAWYE